MSHGIDIHRLTAVPACSTELSVPDLVSQTISGQPNQRLAPEPRYNTRMTGAGLMRALVCLVLCASTGACLRSTEFHCALDTDCSNAGGKCETTNFCSFPDTECASGRRYGDFAGSLSKACVAAADGGIDAFVGCPSDYVTVTGGGTHVYKRVPAALWLSQRDRCAAESTSTYLAIPNDTGEMTGITMLGATRTWIGLHDQTTEGMFETVRGGAAPFLPWDTGNGEPNNNPEQDCVTALMTSQLIATDRCGDSYAAICECEP